MSDFKVGDTVRVRDPSRYLVSFGKKVAGRDAIVDRIYRPVGRTADVFVVRFLKRGNRGKEFFERFDARDIAHHPAPDTQP